MKNKKEIKSLMSTIIAQENLLIVEESFGEEILNKVKECIIQISPIFLSFGGQITDIVIQIFNNTMITTQLINKAIDDNEEEKLKEMDILDHLQKIDNDLSELDKLKQKLDFENFGGLN